MKHFCRFAALIAFSVLPLAGQAFTQTSSNGLSGSSSATTAHIYVQTTNGINVYDATASGTLTLVKGSPFLLPGQLGAIDGKYLVTAGTENIHLYAMESNGAIGEQVSEVNTQTYAGAHCGDLTGSGLILDHTGKYLYVQIYDPKNAYCTAWQSYKIASNGDLSFLGETEDDGNSFVVPKTIPTISGNDNFAYSMIFNSDTSTGELLIAPFARSSSGAWENIENFNEKDPAEAPNPYYPWAILQTAADPTGHLAVLMTDDGPLQIGSYTIDSKGNISSTNTYKNMPTSLAGFGNPLMNMSPSGKLVAVGGNNGLQIFHFNGSAPPTSFSALLQPSVNFDQLAWDNNNHLFALSYSSGKLYIYTVTANSIVEVSGSPYSVTDAYGQNGLIVTP